MPTVTQLIPVLQTAIGPTIVISGVGLLLLTMTNRLGRAIDRARSLAGKLASGAPEEQAHITRQLHILWGRARLIRLAITLAAMSALMAAMLIIFLFFTALWQLESAGIISVLFAICLASLVASLIVFIHDINQSLAALKLELQATGVSDFENPQPP